MLLRERLEKDKGGYLYPHGAAAEEVEKHRNNHEQKQPQRPWIKELHSERGLVAPG